MTKIIDFNSFRKTKYLYGYQGATALHQVLHIFKNFIHNTTLNSTIKIIENEMFAFKLNNSVLTFKGDSQILSIKCLTSQKQLNIPINYDWNKEKLELYLQKAINIMENDEKTEIA